EVRDRPGRGRDTPAAYWKGQTSYGRAPFVRRASRGARIMRGAETMTRRELLIAAGAAAAAPHLKAAASSAVPTDVWLKTCRGLICEAYNPPFYPSFDYRADKAVKIATDLNSDSLRYPAASYFAYFPTKSGYPVHPELKG